MRAPSPRYQSADSTTAKLICLLPRFSAELPAHQRIPSDSGFSPEQHLEHLYQSFCTMGSTEMESARFVKFCRDTG